MATKLEICNLATAHLGAGRPITDIDSDSTNEADAIRRVYDTTLRSMLREFRWPFSVKYLALEHVHDGYGYDLSIASLTGASDDSDTEVLVTALDTTQSLHVDVEVATVLATSGGGYITAALYGGASGFTTGTLVKTIGYLSNTAAVGTRITTSVTTADLAYGAYKIRLTPSTGTLSSGAVNAFIAERTGPPVDEWSYAYEYPSDALYVVRIGGASRVDSYDVRVPYKIVHRKKTTDLSGTSYTIGQQILTDEPDAVIEYVSSECLASSASTEQIFPEDFAMAFSLRLAINVAPRLTGGDNGILVKSLWDRYYLELSSAEANAVNEMGSDLPRDSEYIRARD